MNERCFLYFHCFIYRQLIKAMAKTKEQLLNILSQFKLDEKAVSAEPFGNGHINDTLKVTTESGKSKYVLQRINHLIFTNVDMLQNNIQIVTTHIREKLEAKGESDIDRKVLTFLPTKEGKYYYFDGDSYWRVSLLIPNSTSFEEVSPELSYEAGNAFGEFQSMLSDIPEGTLGETIPNFHNMEFRLQQFHDAIKENAAGRLDEVKDLIAEVEKRAYDMCIQERLYREGKLKKHINHCDTKVNNMLFDTDTKQVLCVIDLDTVMPGFVLSDIGDFIRTGANTGAEDDENLDNVNVNMDIFKAYTRGYMEKAKSFLTPTEIHLLPYGGRLLTYMQTVRFLTDYINGDTYYKTHKPKHNLIRTKAQYKLLQSLEAHAEEMDSFMNEWL
jgi:Ser/Thr protein kinase RdoA (MazF antagonist)